jgi:hypothetical protein
MSNVPSHSRTRRTHRRTLSAGSAGSRGSHHFDSYLGPITGAEEVYQQVSIDEAGQVTAGQISPGAIHDPALFAQSIQPVLLVDGLPTLPDVDYPEDVIVFDISVTPRVLYKNEADVWVKLIGPDDIQANSITAGQIATGAVSTSELAVGARLTGELANEAGATPGVFIDSTGILIRDGKLTLEDEFGLTTMTASGFSGSWQDLISLGLYNANFSSGVAGVIANGRSASLPYWTLSNTAGAPVATYLAAGGVKVTFAAINTTKKFVSDPVPMSGDQGIIFGFQYSTHIDSGQIRVVSYYEVSDTEAFTFDSDSTHDSWTVNTVGDTSHLTHSAFDSVRDMWVRLVLEVTELVAHDPDNYMTIEAAWIRDSPTETGAINLNNIIFVDGAGSPEVSVFGDTDFFGTISTQGVGSSGGINVTAGDVLGIDADFSGFMKAARYIVDGSTNTSATGTRNDTNVGASSTMRYTGGAAVTYTGFDATDKQEGRILYIRNVSGFTLTLNHEDAGSLAANRITCPGSANITLAARGGAVLMYDGNVSRWYVVAHTN